MFSQAADGRLPALLGSGALLLCNHCSAAATEDVGTTADALKVTVTQNPSPNPTSQRPAPPSTQVTCEMEASDLPPSPLDPSGDGPSFNACTVSTTSEVSLLSGAMLTTLTCTTAAGASLRCKSDVSYKTVPPSIEATGQGTYQPSTPANGKKPAPIDLATNTCEALIKNALTRCSLAAVKNPPQQTQAIQQVQL